MLTAQLALNQRFDGFSKKCKNSQILNKLKIVKHFNFLDMKKKNIKIKY
jgi:hypothetical protein